MNLIASSIEGEQFVCKRKGKNPDMSRTEFSQVYPCDKKEESGIWRNFR